jgi:hypothetical protein
MTTREEYAKQPLDERLARMARTPDELAVAIRGRSDAVLSRRPDGKNWAATEVICHLRDVDEVFLIRLESILINEELKVYANPSMVERWAEERQYLKNDAAAALAAFRRRREDTLAFMKKRTPVEIERACVHPTTGRMTMNDVITLLAWHDDNHLDQLNRAIEGRA